MIRVKGVDAYTLREREPVHVSKLWYLTNSHAETPKQALQF